MKINVEFDLTPEEFRQALGLPDVEAFQKDLLNRIYKQMESGTEGYDPMSLMQPFLQQPGLSQNLSQGLSSFGNYQQMMLDMLTKAASSVGSGGGAASKAQESKEEGTSNSGTSSSGSADKSGSGGSSRKSTATARSRSKRDS
ncbi:hypothetical protein FHR95_002353 [Halomonas fontilapidosi]|uniref:Uncharacterized protein n=1 Tax=Halomonas fontilapidosi TaxID=616675 RepID=A0A7W5DLP5_9GAMM|nr:hypothetical protein [Halomonas fontilapidosi]MBB3184779.1 hypothetical protein [Halomonas fontilapidosi]